MNVFSPGQDGFFRTTYRRMVLLFNVVQGEKVDSTDLIPCYIISLFKSIISTEDNYIYRSYVSNKKLKLQILDKYCFSGVKV